MGACNPLNINGRECANQHDLLTAVLLAVGGVDAGTLKPKGSNSKIADVIFPAEDWIFEIKSLDADRPNDPAVQNRVGKQFDADTKKFGGPIIFGTVNVPLEKMPEPVANNLLRRMGNSVQQAAKAANRQIRATKELWGRPEARGCVAIVSPHFDLTPDTQRWLVTDAIRGSKLSSVHAFVLCQSSMLSTFGFQTFDSCMQFYDRTWDRMPRSLKERIGFEWARVHQNFPVEGLLPDRPTKWRIDLDDALSAPDGEP